MTQRTPQRPPELSGFQAVALIGSGGFSDVFRYQQLDLGRDVAVKVLLANLGPGAQSQFRVEANLMAKLSNHPSIVSVHSSGVARDGRAYLVMEFCPAAPLATRIRRGPLAVPKALEIAIQIAGAVETAHRLGILHRDIKPANILFTQYGRPALSDFGIAGNTTGDAIDAFSIIWAPPEQIAGQATGPAGDVYSLAATTWAMLTGHSPVESAGGGDDLWTLTQRVRHARAPRTGRPDVPESLERILAAALAKDPAARYPSALSYARALQQVQVELRCPLTPVDVFAEDDWDADLAGDGTRVTGFAAFDPDAEPELPSAQTVEVSPPPPPSPAWMNAGHDHAPVLQHGLGSSAAGPRTWTGPAIPRVDPEADPAQAAPVPAETPKRSRRPLFLVAAMTLVVVAVAAGAGTVLTKTVAGTSEALTTPTPRPVDPIGQVVPSPAGLQVTRDGERIIAVWTNREPVTGDFYLYRVQVPGEERAYERVDEPTVTVTAPPGRTCLDVVLSRRNGRYSDPAVSCTEG